MATVQPGLITIRGKMGDGIITREGRYASHYRRAVKPGTKKEEKALKAQYSRTKLLNMLASEVNAVVSELARELKSSRFYMQVQSRLRKESSDNRLLLLRQLKGIEVNPVYPLGRHLLPAVKLATKGNEVQVSLSVKGKPLRSAGSDNCYCYEVSLITWNRKEDTADCSKRHSDWIQRPDELPVFDFVFEKPAGAVYWLLGIRLRLGLNNCELKRRDADGMQIMDTGSFDKREQAWLEELTVQSAVRQPEDKKEPLVIERVKARVVH